MKTPLFLIATLGLVCTAFAQTACPTNKHKVSSLPGWGVSPTLFPCNYAGTIESSRQPGGNHNLFYWLFKNTSLSATAPLIIWIQGETGWSATQGLFVQNGPLTVTQTTKGNNTYFNVNPADDGTNLGEVADILYLDQPVGTGFSYGANDTDLLTSMSDVSREFVNFIDSFMTMYPEYKKPRNIILMGESTAGKYLPVLTKGLDDYINYQGGQISIRAVMIGNPFQSIIQQRVLSFMTAETLNIIDDSNMAQISSLRTQCIEQSSNASGNPMDAYETCVKILSYVTDVGGNIASFDGRKSYQEWAAMITPFTNYLSNSSYKAQVYQALHVENSTKSQVFISQNKAVLDALSSDSIKDYTRWYDWLIGNNYSTFLYVGEWDQRDALLSMQPWLKNSKYLDPIFWESSRKIYYINNTYTGGMRKVGGYWRSAPDNLLTLFTMPKAGHSALRSDIPTLMQILGDYYGPDKKLLCHSGTNSDCETAQTMCAAMNTCNSNGYCQQGQCICNAGFAGADCGENAWFLTNYFNKKFVLNGTQSVIFEYREGLYPGEQYQLTISSQQPMDIYLNQVSAQGAVSIEPNQFNNVAAFKGQNFITLSSDQFPSLSTFALAIRINGVQHYNNKYLMSQFTVQFTVQNQQSLTSLQNSEDSEPEVIQLISKPSTGMKKRTRQPTLD